MGDQYTFIAMAATAKAIVAYHTGKRAGISTTPFMEDLSERVLAGFGPYCTAVPKAFGRRPAGAARRGVTSAVRIHRFQRLSRLKTHQKALDLYRGP